MPHPEPERRISSVKPSPQSVGGRSERSRVERRKQLACVGSLVGVGRQSGQDRIGVPDDECHILATNIDDDLRA
jgi:hypothetical protein